MTEDGAVADAKRAVRARMRNVRAAIAADATDRARRSAAICDAVVATIESRLTPPRRRLRVLLYDPLPGEPDMSTVATWCAANDVATYLPVVDGDALRVEPGDVDPPCSTSSSCRDWRSRRMAHGSAKAAGTSIAS